MTTNGTAYAWPNVQPGQVEEVILNGLPMQLVPGKYTVQEADRFGEKVSQGDPKYADFNPYESAQAVSTLVSGVGLRRYTDVQDPTTVTTYYKESSNVSCVTMPVVLSPEMLQQALPGATGPAVWIGDITIGGVLHTVAVGPNAIWQRATNGTWSVSVALPAAPVANAVSVFRNTLIIGYGNAHTAQSTTDLTTLVAVTGNPGPGVGNLYVYAATADHATSYVAGSTTQDPTIVMASLTPTTGYATPVQTGSPVLSLAPGGGVALVYVGKVDELGEIDNNNGLYRSLIPFDSPYAGNCTPLKWYLASGADAQRGPTVLVFPRGHGLWMYAPSTITSGDSFNIAPWTQPWLDPPNAKGAVRAILGSSRWLYFSVTRSADGHTWIYRRDAATGASHTWLDLGAGACYAMALTQNVPAGGGGAPGNPVLLIGYGNSVISVVIPLDGDNEQDDPACRYNVFGCLDLPDTELGFPDEDKIPFSVRVIGDNLSPNTRWFEVFAAWDGGPYQSLGLVNTGPKTTELFFPPNIAARRLSWRICFHSTDGSTSPKLYGVTLRMSLNPKLYRLFVLQATVPTGSFATLADNLQNPYSLMQQLWQARREGFPVDYTDPWNDGFKVRILKMQQTQMLRQPDMVPETSLDFTLLEMYASAVPPGGPVALEFLYDTVQPDGNLPANLYGYDQPLSQYDTVNPI